MAAVLFGAIFSATDVAAAALTKKQAEKVINAFIDDPCEDYFIKKVRSTKAFDEIGYLTWAENYFDKNDFKKCVVKKVEKAGDNVYGVVVDLEDEDGLNDEYVYGFFLTQEGGKWLIAAFGRGESEDSDFFIFDFRTSKFVKMK